MTTTEDQYLPALNQFAGMVWGNSQTVLKHHPDGFQFIDLGGFFDAFRSLFAGVVTHDKLLVRDEYLVAKQELETATYQRGAYVTGQPGIGKTLFLIYLLVQRLGERQAVVLQFPGCDEYYALFTRGTVTFHPVYDTAPLHQSPSIWALCDSNADVTGPPGVFKGKKCVRIIQTTSPRPARWKWSKQVGARCYIMDIWSKEEVMNLATLLRLDVQRMTTLAEKWGSPPRGLLNYICLEDSEITTRYRNRAGQAVKQCDLPDAPSMFYFFRPMKPSTGIYRELLSIYVPTETVRRILAEALPEQNDHIKLQFYNDLSYHPSTRHTAGLIFESWFHNFVIAKKSIACKWVVQPEDSGHVTIQFPTAPVATDLLPAIRDAPVSATPPYYWIPSKTNFPGIDSVLVLEGEIFAFQVTLRSVHKSSIVGLERLREMLPANLKDLPWRVVFVGPEEDGVKKVAEHWAGKLFFPTQDEHIRVGYSGVDPVEADVTYMEYLDESDAVSTESEELMEVDEE